MTPVRYPLLVAAGYLVSRVGYFALGVRFDDSPLQNFWQYIDPVLLREDLLESVWHFHAQPPLYNLYLGGALKLAGDGDPRPVFVVTHLLVGLVGVLALFALLRRLGASPRLAALVSLAFFASPAVVLYENWLYVEHIVLAALLVAALGLHLFASGRGTRYATAAFGALAAVVLMRTLFHPVWLLLVVALVWWLQPSRRRQVLVAAAVPVLLVAAVQIKASVQFGNTSMTSCTGLSIQRVTTGFVSDADRRELVARGVGSTYSLEHPYVFLSRHPELFRAERKRGVPVLDQPYKSNGRFNVGHSLFLDFCPQLARDGLEFARERPGALRRGVQSGAEIYWRPSSHYDLFSERNRDSVYSLERAAAFAQGQLDRDPPPADYSLPAQLDEMAWLVLIAYICAFVLGGRLLLASRREGGERSPEVVVFAFVLFTVAFVTTGGILLESGENNRFHHVLDPLVIAMLTHFALKARARRREA